MSIEWFSKLKEIDSLSKMRINHLKTKQDQEDRVSKLNERRQKALMQITILQKEIMSVNHELSLVEGKIKTSTEQKQRLMDLGGDEKKIQLYSQEINAEEEKGLTLLSEIESKETEVSDLKTFSQGLEKTIKEIFAEANVDIEAINKEISNIDLRLGLLKDELPPDYRQILGKISAKNLAHGPFTRIDQGSCYFCRFKISRIEESEIDMQKNLKTCPQCSRIFLPYGA